MGGSLGEFKAKLESFALTVNGRAKEGSKRLVRSVFRRIVVRTPVRSGRARASWNLSAGTPNFDFLPAGEEVLSRSAATAVAMAAADRTLESWDGKTPLYIANGLPYIGLLEHGSSEQAPQGMVALTLAEAETKRSLAEELPEEGA